MINRLKRKFLIIGTVFMFILMTVLVLIMNIVNSYNVAADADSVLDMLSHDEEVMAIVRSRMNWELRNAVIEGTKALHREVSERELLGAFGYALSTECDDYMRIAFPEQYEEYNEKLKG